MSSATLDNFWLRMGALFGHTWASQYGVNPNGVSGDTWAAALAGLTGEQIANGLRETLMLGAEFPPSAPLFRALCIGIPTLAATRIEMRAGYPSPSAFTRLVWRFLDGYAYRQSSADKADRLLRDAYALAVDSAMRGEPLPEDVNVFIEPPRPQERAPAKPETAARHLAEIDEILGPKPSDEPETAGQ